MLGAGTAVGSRHSCLMIIRFDASPASFTHTSRPLHHAAMCQYHQACAARAAALAAGVPCPHAGRWALVACRASQVVIDRNMPICTGCSSTHSPSTPSAVRGCCCHTKALGALPSLAIESLPVALLGLLSPLPPVLLQAPVLQVRSRMAGAMSARVACSHSVVARHTPAGDRPLPCTAACGARMSKGLQGSRVGGSNKVVRLVCVLAQLCPAGSMATGSALAHGGSISAPHLGQTSQIAPVQQAG